MLYRLCCMIVSLLLDFVHFQVADVNSRIRVSTIAGGKELTRFLSKSGTTNGSFSPGNKWVSQGPFASPQSPPDTRGEDYWWFAPTK